MATNLDIDDKLIEEAKRLGGHPGKREAVERALLAYVEGLERLAILELAGTLDGTARLVPHRSPHVILSIGCARRVTWLPPRSCRALRGSARRVHRVA